MSQDLAIRTHQLTKQFDLQIAVNDIDLQVKTGEVYGLIGPNGAGKTTLIRLLAAAEEPTVGEIYINGERLRHDRNQPHLKQYIGYLPDDYPLYEDLIVWDYLDYFARLYHLRGKRRSRRLSEVLELVELTHKRHSQITTLSRGMKQRLGLARTLIHEPILLLLDEPVSGLDPIARHQFRSIIKTLQEAGMTILISSHVLSDLEELCTTIGIMELGFLVESASLKDLYHRLSRQRLLLSTRGDLNALKGELCRNPLVKDIQIFSASRQVQAHYAGGPDEAADLLRSLIMAGIPLDSFSRTQENLEEIFFKIGHQQAS